MKIAFIGKVFNLGAYLETSEVPGYPMGLRAVFEIEKPSPSGPLKTISFTCLGPESSPIAAHLPLIRVFDELELRDVESAEEVTIGRFEIGSALGFETENRHFVAELSVQQRKLRIVVTEGAKECAFLEFSLRTEADPIIWDIDLNGRWEIYPGESPSNRS